MKSTLAQLDTAEARLLKQWKTLVWHHRHLRTELAAKRLSVVTVILSRSDEGRADCATAIRAIRAQRKALDEREAVIAYITHHAGMTKRNALETAIHQSMLTLLAEHIRAGMHLGAP